MSRYKVTTTSQAVYFVDARSAPDAANQGIALADEGMRPAYRITTTADVEFYAEPEPEVTRMRKRIAASHTEAEA